MAVIRGIVLVAHPVHVFTRRFAPIIRAAIIKTRIKRRAVSVLRASAPVCKAAHLSAPIVPAIIIIRRVAISLVSKVTALVLSMVSKRVAISPVSKVIVLVLSTDSRRVATSPVSKRVAISPASRRVAISLVSKATVPVRNMDSRKVVISLVEAISLVRAAISLVSRATIPIMVENLTEHPMVTHIRRSNMVRTIPMPSTQ